MAAVNRSAPTTPAWIPAWRYELCMCSSLSSSRSAWKPQPKTGDSLIRSSPLCQLFSRPVRKMSELSAPLARQVTPETQMI